jgi:hypothetical protein
MERNYKILVFVLLGAVVAVCAMMLTMQNQITTMRYQVYNQLNSASPAVATVVPASPSATVAPTVFNKNIQRTVVPTGVNTPSVAK